MSGTAEQQGKISALILAAGKGTRMKSEKAKVLHEVFFAPMIYHVLDAVQPLFEQIIVVVGHQGREVQKALTGYQVLFAEQKIQLGTAHAVLSAENHLLGTGGTVMILCGDTPLIRTETLRLMLQEHFDAGDPLTVMTTILENPTHYGRIVTDGQGKVTRIIEEKDASSEQKQIREVNAGIYCAEIPFLLDSLREIGTDNKQGEFYLTDAVAVAVSKGKSVHRFLCADAEEVLGVNSRIELAQAHSCLQLRRNQQLMTAGVTLLQPASILAEKGVVIGSDTVIEPSVHLQGRTRIGCNCLIGSFVILRDTILADGVCVGAFSHLVGADIGQDEIIPPHTSISHEHEKEERIENKTFTPGVTL
jgi:bifunctional UDP-N-acetylglucosamine pyrophosphorylase / glucosamine-1-phosphate N-acetyltransferase